MSKALVLALTTAIALTVSGCATTGDPKAGGLFGWSEAKAKERQAGMRAAVHQEERRAADLQEERQSLENQISAMKKQRENFLRRVASANENTGAKRQARVEVNEMSKHVRLLGQYSRELVGMASPGMDTKTRQRIRAEIAEMDKHIQFLEQHSQDLAAKASANTDAATRQQVQTEINEMDKHIQILEQNNRMLASGQAVAL